MIKKKSKKSITVNGQTVELKERIVPTQDSGDVKVMEAGFTAKFESISDNLLQNSNGTGYRIATGSFANPNGEEITRSFQMWEKNYQKAMEAGGLIPGDSYLSTIQFTPTQDKPGLVMSHLSSATRATHEDFGVSNEIFESNLDEVVEEGIEEGVEEAEEVDALEELEEQ